jgi:hypothetical protein
MPISSLETSWAASRSTRGNFGTHFASVAFTVRSLRPICRIGLISSRGSFDVKPGEGLAVSGPAQEKVQRIAALRKDVQINEEWESHGVIICRGMNDEPSDL